MPTKAPKASPATITEVTLSLAASLEPGLLTKITIAPDARHDAAELSPQLARDFAEALATGSEWAGHALPPRRVLLVLEDGQFAPYIDEEVPNLTTWMPAKADVFTWDGSRRSDQIERIQQWRDLLATANPDVVVVSDPLRVFGGDCGFWQHRMRRFQTEAAAHQTAIVLVLDPPLGMLNGLLPEYLRPPRIYPSINRACTASFVLGYEGTQLVVKAERRLRVKPAEKAA
jgi:hypothetical protein